MVPASARNAGVEEAEANGEERGFVSPHAHSRCHIDPYLAKLHVRMKCTLTQYGEETAVLHAGDPAQLKVEVGLKGPLLHHLCGEICVRAHVECIGPGPERSFGTKEDNQEIGDKCCDPKSFDEKGWCWWTFYIDIPADTFVDYDPDKCGQVCCFAVTATTLDRCGNPGHIACWCNGPCVMIHTAPEA